MSDELMFALDGIDFDLLDTSTSPEPLTSFNVPNLPVVNTRTSPVKSEISTNSKRTIEPIGSDLPFESLAPKLSKNQNGYDNNKIKDLFVSPSLPSHPLRLQVAIRLHKLDKILQRLQGVENENSTLKGQMNGFRQTAQEIRTMYQCEREANNKIRHTIDQINLKYEKCNEELDEKKFKCEQLQAQVDELIAVPICYDELAVKYLHLVQKCDDKSLTKSEKMSIDLIQKYCAKKNLKYILSIDNESGKAILPLYGSNSASKISKRKLTNSSNKVTYVDKHIQCNLIEENSERSGSVEEEPSIPKSMNSVGTQCANLKTTCTRSIQCACVMRTQSTSTKSLIKYEQVGTSCPEDTFQSINVEEIITETSQWPMKLIKPIPAFEEVYGYQPFRHKSVRTIGTCTDIQNIRYPIGYLLSKMREEGEQVFSEKDHQCNAQTFTGKLNFDEIYQSLSFVVLGIMEKASQFQKFPNFYFGKPSASNMISNNNMCLDLLWMIYKKVTENDKNQVTSEPGSNIKSDEQNSLPMNSSNGSTTVTARTRYKREVSSQEHYRLPSPNLDKKNVKKELTCHQNGSEKHFEQYPKSSQEEKVTDYQRYDVPFGGTRMHDNEDLEKDDCPRSLAQESAEHNGICKDSPLRKDLQKESEGYDNNTSVEHESIITENDETGKNNDNIKDPCEEDSMHSSEEDSTCSQTEMMNNELKKIDWVSLFGEDDCSNDINDKSPKEDASKHLLPCEYAGGKEESDYGMYDCSASSSSWSSQTSLEEDANVEFYPTNIDSKVDHVYQENDKESEQVTDDNCDDFEHDLIIDEKEMEAEIEGIPRSTSPIENVANDSNQEIYSNSHKALKLNEIRQPNSSMISKRGNDVCEYPPAVARKRKLSEAHLEEADINAIHSDRLKNHCNGNLTAELNSRVKRSVERAEEENISNEFFPNSGLNFMPDTPKSPPWSMETKMDEPSIQVTLKLNEMPANISARHYKKKSNKCDYPRQNGIFGYFLSNYQRRDYYGSHRQKERKDSSMNNNPKLYKHIYSKIKQFCDNDDKISPQRDHRPEGEQANQMENHLEFESRTVIQTINDILGSSQKKLMTRKSLIVKVIIDFVKKVAPLQIEEKDLPSSVQEMPPYHLSSPLKRLMILLKEISFNENNQFDKSFYEQLLEGVRTIMFTCQQDTLTLFATLNLTQLYLMVTQLLGQNVSHHHHQQQQQLQNLVHTSHVRLFLANCLYFYNTKSIPMIHEVLMWYPTVLPPREDRSYVTSSDPLIAVLKHLLMCTKYDMCTGDLRGRTLLSKLRYEYHFTPFKPTFDEVLENLLAHLKSGQFRNLEYAFALFCKRLEPAKTLESVLRGQLLPLANDYYSKALDSDMEDEKIDVLLNIISVVVKPLPRETDIEVFLSLFTRFLYNVERPLIQEAAICSIIRLQRFNYQKCCNVLKNCNITLSIHKLRPLTLSMLHSFIYRKSIAFWKNLLQ